MDLELAGQKCIITGGSKGIGAATGEVLAIEGADVALVARGEEALVARAEELVKRNGVRAFAIVGDLSTAHGVADSMASAIDALGGVDVLVNNAGSSEFGNLDMVSDEDWSACIDLKLMGYVRAMRAVLPAMREQGSGRIVNVLGIAGVAASAGYITGCINSALAHVTRSTALLVAKEGISVNALHPGPTATERVRSGIEAVAAAGGVTPEEFMRKQVPLGRVAQPREVAEMIAVLASGVASFMTGSAIQVDGGVARSVS